MQKVFDIIRKDCEEYANAYVVGTYIEKPPCLLCKGYLRHERIRPLTLEWAPDSDVVADFTWPAGLGQLVVTQRVKELLEKEAVTGATFGPVEFFQNPKLKKPTRKNYRTKPRIWLPYDGPPLWDLEVASWCHLDLEKSKRILKKECTLCKRQDFEVGPNAPVVVDAKTWDGSELFRIHEIGIVFALSRVKQLIEDHGFTNVQLKERGWINKLG